MIFRVLDIETVLDPAAWSKPTSTTQVVPGDRISFDRDTFTAEVKVMPAFPPAHAHRVVAISYVDLVFDPSSNQRYELSDMDSLCIFDEDAEGPNGLKGEKAILDWFSRGMKQGIHFVSWNGRQFDLPVIVLRSFKHKIPCQWYYDQTNVRYRYSTEGHNDLMDFLSDYGACRPMSLADACHLVGLPGKLDISGASIEGEYQEYKEHPEKRAEIINRVATYCLQDSLQTALIFLLSRFHIGKLTHESLNVALDSFVKDEVKEVFPFDISTLKIQGEE